VVLVMELIVYTEGGHVALVYKKEGFFHERTCFQARNCLLAQHCVHPGL
jgi:hypothetical protein